MCPPVWLPIGHKSKVDQFLMFSGTMGRGHGTVVRGTLFAIVVKLLCFVAPLMYDRVIFVIGLSLQLLEAGRSVKLKSDRVTAGAKCADDILSVPEVC